jgi:glycosyltransferase involved in cell wall biosynthesis
MAGVSDAVTVVISTVDRPPLLSRCLTALLRGTRLPREVVVVDQGGSGDTVRVVDDARAAGLTIRHVTQPRRGLSASQNAGVSVAGTPVVAIVDDDCLPDRRWVQVVEESFAAATGPMLLTGRVLPRPAEGDRVAAVSTRDSQRRVEWVRPPMPWHLGTGGNYAVDREAYLAVGGNDERLGTGSGGRAGNDLDLFYRLVRSGVTARYEPDLLVEHERSTLAEFRSRRSSYGFGTGAMLGLWLREGDPRALVVLAGWIRLRGLVARQRRREGGVTQEAKVLAGTVAGLIYGLRQPRKGRCRGSSLATPARTPGAAPRARQPR